jgi:hypothetical protein
LAQSGREPFCEGHHQLRGTMQEVLCHLELPVTSALEPPKSMPAGAFGNRDDFCPGWPISSSVAQPRQVAAWNVWCRSEQRTVVSKYSARSIINDLNAVIFNASYTVNIS